MSRMKLIGITSAVSLAIGVPAAAVATTTNKPHKAKAVHTQVRPRIDHAGALAACPRVSQDAQLQSLRAANRQERSREQGEAKSRILGGEEGSAAGEGESKLTPAQRGQAHAERHASFLAALQARSATRKARMQAVRSRRHELLLARKQCLQNFHNHA